MGNKKISLVELAKQLESASKACKVKGYSRDTFNWFGELYENGEEEALYEIGKKKGTRTYRKGSCRNSDRASSMRTKKCGQQIKRKRNFNIFWWDKVSMEKA